MTKLEEIIELVARGVTIGTAAMQTYGSYSKYKHRTSDEERKQVFATRQRVIEAQKAQPNAFHYSVSCHPTQFYLPNDKWEKVKARAERQGVSVSKYLNGLVARDLQDS